METIYNIAKDNAVSWGVLATALDNNFDEMALNKADVLDVDEQISTVNNAVDAAINTFAINLRSVRGQIQAVQNDIPTRTSQLTNDNNYSQCGNYTYAQLTLLKDTNGLIPGGKYILTDYDCIWLAYYSDEQVYTESGEGWQIVLTATSNNTFSYDVSITYAADSAYAQRGGLPILNCKYDFDGSRCMWNAPESKGCIFYLEDSNYNALNYDFKHIKFKRYRINSITPNTTVDSKSNGTWGCYRTYLTEDDLNDNSDQRSWIGAGAESEKQLLNDVFSGDFRNTIWGQAAYSSDFMKQFIKPYANTEDDSKSYIGLRQDLNNTTFWKYQNNSNTNPAILKANFNYTGDSKMFYTFDLNGTDASNNPKIHHNRFVSTVSAQQKLNLCNTVIQLFDVDSSIVAYNKFERCSNNTIQLIPGIYSSATLTHNTAEYFVGNIISACYWGLNNFKVLQYNLILRSYFYEVVSTSTMRYNVIFGAYNGMSFKECNHNILFGDTIKVQLEGKTTYESPADGNYWYNDFANDWFGYNILSPFQYSHFYPHTNTNTCVMPYNKGVTFLGTIQHNYFTRLRWGVKMEYGSCQGCYFGGDVIRTKFCGSCWAGQAHGQKVIETNPIPALSNCDVKAYYVDRQTVIPKLTTEQKTLLAESGSPKMWCIEGSTSKITKYSSL